jgi:hypothetical protein
MTRAIYPRLPIIINVRKSIIFGKKKINTRGRNIRYVVSMMRKIGLAKRVKAVSFRDEIFILFIRLCRI